jgi:hypothetical protein
VSAAPAPLRNGSSKGHPAPARNQGGWGRAVSKVGRQKSRSKARPRRDGKPELLLLSVTLADGKAFFASSQTSRQFLERD